MHLVCCCSSKELQLLLDLQSSVIKFKINTQRKNLHDHLIMVTINLNVSLQTLKPFYSHSWPRCCSFNYLIGMMFDSQEPKSYNPGFILMGIMIALSGLMLYPIPFLQGKLKKERVTEEDSDTKVSYVEYKWWCIIYLFVSYLYS